MFDPKKIGRKRHFYQDKILCNTGTNHPEQNLQTNLIKTSSIRSDIGLSLISEKQLEADTLKL